MVTKSILTSAVVLGAALGMLVPAAPAAAQQEVVLVHACYVPASGTVYRIKLPGLAAACLSSEHVAFSWNERGVAGETGPAGPQGSPGPAGASGAQGPQGAVGPAGASGMPGAVGATGVAGPQGTAGSVGPEGPRGNTGPGGPPGPLGSTGPIGPQGEDGPAGPVGPQGNTGPGGAPGAPGAIGPAGSVGPAGPQGDPGVAGPAGSTGPAGPQGDPGSAGAAGTAGPVGAQGDPGPAGATGPAGPTGPQGPAGSFSGTVTSANTPSTVVERDASGNFSAGTITAALSGNASTATTAASFSGALAGDVTGTQGTTVVDEVGGETAADVAAATTLANAATSANTASAIVRRDANGGFSAGALTLSGKLTQTHVDGLVASGTLGSGSIPASGAGARLMWYPRKAAFRAGHASGTQWDDGGIGTYSVAMGSSTTASGIASIAMGFSATASGLVSVALGNNAQATGSSSTALGLNTIASGASSTAMGSSTTASGSASIAMGSSTTASGSSSIAMGSSTTASGDRSTAMGFRASTNGQLGAFVYGDFSGVPDVTASAANQATWRVSGGFRIFTSSNLSTGTTIDAGGGSWNTVSDRNRKENFLALDGEDMLARLRNVPVMSWNYIAQGEEVRHIGPMAQDWHEAFGLNADSLTINTGDFDGVNLAAVQALERRTTALQEQNRALQLLIAVGREERQILVENIAALTETLAEARQRLARLEKVIRP